MSRVTSVPRAVGWAVVATAPLAAALLLVGTASRRVRQATRRPSIHDVPPRPALWDARPPAPVVGRASLRDVPPVPPENNHAPPTPPHGVPRQVF